MTSLVTGATGFIGRHLVTELQRRGQTVRALYRDEAKRKTHLASTVETTVETTVKTTVKTTVETTVEAIQGDACDADVMRQAVAGVETIFHCAAAHSTCPADEMRRTNLQSVRCLFDAVEAAEGSPRIVLMSSINVMGNRNYSGATEKNTSRKRTKTPHVDLKIKAELLAEEQQAAGQDVVIIRPGLVYGDGDANLPRLAQAIKRGKFVFIGSRNNVVPLVHVSDMVTAMVAVANHPKPSPVYNITDGSATTIGQLVSELCKAIGCEVPEKKLPLIVPKLVVLIFGLLRRDGPISRSALQFLGTSRHVDIALARNELGFEPQTDSATGIAALTDYFQAATAEM